MQRRLFTIATSFSLVSCVAIAMLWTLSFFWYGRVTNAPSASPTGADREFAVYSHAGMLQCSTWKIEWDQPQPPPSAYIWQIIAWPAHGVWRDVKDEFLMGVIKFQYRAYGARFRIGTLRERHLRISYAFPTGAFAVAPLLWLRRFARARSRRTAGQCQRCGYDLRASPGRCPECGAIPANVERAFLQKCE